MSYYSVANSHCNKYREAADKIAEANSYLLKARHELAKNKTESITNLIKEIDELCQYVVNKSTEITKIINKTLEEARSRDIAAQRRAEAQAEYNKRLQQQNNGQKN